MSGPKAAAIVVALGILSGCGPSEKDRTTTEMRWEESVTLAAGETVRIRRHVVFRQETAFGGGYSSAPMYTTSSIELVPPAADFVMWNAPMIPILLDRDPETNEWVVIAGEDGGGFWEANGKPCPPQWAFRLRGGVWTVQPVPQTFMGRLPNLLADLRVDDDQQYTEATFGPIALDRKAHQLSPFPKIGPGLVHVGVIYERATCKPDEPPRFTDVFVPTERNGYPDRSRFPRM